MTYLIGFESRDGVIVAVKISMWLCSRCQRDEYRTDEDGRFLRLTYHDQSPVMHR